ncbi:hypothetical protein JCGZ_07038 [Jatropha curcas]|uniref:TF-B3 domain-containing protein n=1 Tax=Jatropha curcas TaxID=180498 RepID=A0A067KBF7_JATCU|nr:hypothetical protein JCGZ_07038 [Jatropha curcas]
MATSRVLPCKPHFFQPLLPGFEYQFSIPVAFFKFLKGQACDKAVLRSRAGQKLWHVNINGGRFEDGWKEFVQNHDLHVGDILVFELEGNMVFDVLVFDPSFCEKEYPSFATSQIHVKEEKVEIEEEEEHIAKRSTPEESKQKKKTRTSFEAAPAVVKHPYFEVKLTSYSSKESRLCLPMGFARLHGLNGRNCKMILLDQENRSWLVDLGFKKSDDRVFIGRGWYACCVANYLKAGDSLIFELIENGKRPTLKFSNKLKKEKQPITDLQAKASSVLEHPYLKIQVTSNSAIRSRVCIPKKFAALSNLRNRCGIILMDQEGRCWPAKLWNKAGEAYIHGWREFHVANDLKPGDCLIFKLTERGKRPVFKLCRKLIKKRQPVTTVEVEANSSVLKCPYFVAKVTPSSVTQSKMYIPRNFTRLNNLNDTCCEMILKNQEGMSWLVKLWNKQSDNEAYILDWNNFRVANGLKPGDSFIFELIENGKRPVLKMCRLNFEHKANQEQCHQDAEAGSSLMRHPYFYVTMKASYFKYQLRIPRNFARRHSLSKCSKMILENEKGRSWSVSLGKDSGGSYIGCGWAEFVKANCLREGTVFMLELVKRGDEPMMKFYGMDGGTAACNKSHYKDSGVQRGSFENWDDVKPNI